VEASLGWGTHRTTGGPRNRWIGGASSGGGVSAARETARRRTSRWCRCRCRRWSLAVNGRRGALSWDGSLASGSPGRSDDSWAAVMNPPPSPPAPASGSGIGRRRKRIDLRRLRPARVGGPVREWLPPSLWHLNTGLEN
jgi:hypothetical protein